MKKCNYCLIEKDLIEFPKKGAKCKSCVSLYKKEYAIINKDKIREYLKDYYSENRDDILKKSKEYTIKNSERIKEYKNDYNKNNSNLDYHKKYREDNKELISEKRKEYYQKNKEDIKEKVREYVNDNREYVNKRNKQNRDNKKEYYNELNRSYVSNRKTNDPLYRLKCSIRGLISQSFKLKYTNKSKKTIEILGCDYECFKKHIENQFNEDMNWDNYASYWQLDHKIPISWANTELEVYELNHYTNFQPLYWKDNITKGNRWSD